MSFSPSPKFNAFFLLTGVSFVTFASGFGPCLFNPDSVDACVAVANHWLGVFKQMGNYLIGWAFALLHAVMPYTPPTDGFHFDSPGRVSSGFEAAPSSSPHLHAPMGSPSGTMFHSNPMAPPGFRQYNFHPQYNYTSPHP